MSQRRAEFDYVIVGAGSAGCVLANRLSQNASLEICLIEAGPNDNSIGIRMPAALTLALESDKYNWKFESEPEAALQASVVGRLRIVCLTSGRWKALSPAGILRAAAQGHFR
jgi:choline dehydrogenase